MLFLVDSVNDFAKLYRLEADAPQVFPVFGKRWPLFATQVDVTYDCQFTNILHLQNPGLSGVKDISSQDTLARSTLQKVMVDLLSRIELGQNVVGWCHLIDLGDLVV